MRQKYDDVYKYELIHLAERNALCSCSLGLLDDDDAVQFQIGVEKNDIKIRTCTVGPAASISFESCSVRIGICFYLIYYYLPHHALVPFVWSQETKARQVCV